MSFTLYPNQFKMREDGEYTGLAAIKGDAGPSDYVLVQDAQPSSETNKIWVDTSTNTSINLVEPSDLCRKNLLDNWYFVGGGSQQGGQQFPINQRGQIAYSADGIYIIDRWKMRGTATVQVNSDGLIIGAASSFHGIVQSIANGVNKLAGKKVTLSAFISGVSGTGKGVLALSNGSNASNLGTTIEHEDFSSPGLITFTTVVPSTLEKDYLNFWVHVPDNNNFGYTITAAKLELGDTQTLAHLENGVWVLNEIPNYQQELYKCQTYLFYRPFNNTWQRFPATGALGTTTTSPRISFNIPAPMNGPPVVALNNIELFYSTTSKIVNNYASISNIQWVTYASGATDIMVALTLASAVTTDGLCYEFNTHSNNFGYIQVSSEPS